MGDTIDEHAQETIHEHGQRHRGVAVLIAALAAALALADLGEKQHQNAYLTYHIAVSNDWAFYQAKNARATTLAAEATILANLPGADGPGTQKAIQNAKETEARYRDEPGGDGMKQLAVRAKVNEENRDHAFHRYHQYELVVGALQIAIVLASVSVVTSVATLAVAAATIGGLAALFGLAIAVGIAP